MKIETVLRKIERHFREEQEAYENYIPPMAYLTGAKSEAMGCVYMCKEIRGFCLTLRRKIKKVGEQTKLIKRTELQCETVSAKRKAVRNEYKNHST